MALIDLWKSDRKQLADKHIQQIIAFAGHGRLLDDSPASKELREFLSQVPSDVLRRYIEECLGESFSDSGLALQDLVNEVGNRLGFAVTPGRYRGTRGRPGQDGVWRYPDGHAVVAEVKTTDAFRIDLNTIASYREVLCQTGEISQSMSSMLVVVGRQDTGDLEAQIRGSRHAWDMRLISADALVRLMLLKEEVEDPKIVQRIHAILLPREFTRLDEIVDIAFSAAEDIKHEEPEEEIPDTTPDGTKFTPVSFHAACVDRVEKIIGSTPVKESRTSFRSANRSLGLVCAVSKAHRRDQNFYWFGFHPHQSAFLESCGKGYAAFGCGSPDALVLFPFDDFKKWLDEFNTTRTDDHFHWHVQITRQGNEYQLLTKQEFAHIDVSKYLVPSDIPRSGKSDDSQ